MTHLFVSSKVHSPSADCIQKPRENETPLKLRRLFDTVGINGPVDVGEFGSANR
jgi:hypothetical protein